MTKLLETLHNSSKESVSPKQNVNRSAACMVKANSDELVTQQLETMDQLLFLQSEIERCQEIEGELIKLHEEAKLHSVQGEISEMKLKLKEIQLTFEAQTEDIIRTYKSEGACSTIA